MQIDLALLADAATIDGTGKLNILGIFDHISAAEFPARHERMCLVFRIAGGLDEAGERKISIVVLSPDGDEVSRMDGTVTLTTRGRGDPSRIPQVVHMDGFVFPEPGRYAIDIVVDGEVLETVPLTLTSTRGMAQA